VETCPRWALPDPPFARAFFRSGFTPDQATELMTERVELEQLLQLMNDGFTPAQIIEMLVDSV
jgi:hypothetical protein